MAAPIDPAWALSQIGARDLQAAGLDGAGQLVAVIDDGIDVVHPLIAGRVAGAVGVDPISLVVKSTTDGDRTGHGTAIGSLIAGGRVDGVDIGVAPGACLISIDALGALDVVAAIVVALEAAATLGANVVCLALGTRSHNPILAAAAGGLRRCGVLTVASAGNDGPGTIRSPADYAEVLSVGSCDASGTVLQQSGSMTSNGICYSPDVVAPGKNLRAASRGGGWRLVTGSSYATALVAGIAAMLRQAHPDVSASDLHQAVASAAQPNSAGDNHRSRRGVVDGMDALSLLGQHTASHLGRPPRPTIAQTKRWVDPFAVELIDRAAPDERQSVVVASHPDDSTSVERIAGDAQSAARGVIARYLPLTETAIVSGPAAGIRDILDNPALHVISAARLDLAPITRDSAVSRRAPGLDSVR